MKKLTTVMALTLSLTTASAHAGVLRCTKAAGTAETAPSYLLVLNLDPSVGKAAIFTDVGGGGSNWDLVYPSARAMMAMDGGPLSITGTDDSKVNWRKESGCYKIKNATYHFTLNLSSRGSTGQLQLTPNLVVKPGARNCSIPRLARPAPVDLTCDEL